MVFAVDAAVRIRLALDRLAKRNSRQTALPLIPLQTGKVQKRRIHVDDRHIVSDPVARRNVRPGQNHRNPDRTFVHR